MDNITHSLVGAALADLMFPDATRAGRRLAVGAGIVAANLPDIDIAYAAITPAPLGYLLHHRGHTHTVAGVLGLALVLVVASRALPSVRALAPGDRARVWMLMAVALASHLPLDALNSYGVHPFYPLDSRWFFGDAVFIFEPWLWVVLGIGVAWNARGAAARLAAAVPVVMLPLMLVWLEVVPIAAAASLAIVGAVFGWGIGRLSPPVRAGASLAAALLICIGLVGASRAARQTALAALRPDVRGRLVDLVLTPNPASPLCWGIIGVELDEAGGEFVLRRATVSLAPRFKAPTACASHRFASAPGSPPVALRAGAHLAPRDVIRQPLRQLRDLAGRDCWVRAWLQFGRAPVVEAGAIFDLRFAERVGQNFTRMALNPARHGSGCPPNLTDWGLPRADLLRGD